MLQSHQKIIDKSYKAEHHFPNDLAVMSLAGDMHKYTYTMFLIAEQTKCPSGGKGQRDYYIFTQRCITWP